MFSSFSALVKQLGIIDTLAYTCSRVLSAVFLGHACLNKYYITKQAATSDSLVPERRGKDIVVRELNLAESLTLDFERPSSVVESRFCQGGHCYAAFRKDALAGYLWLNFGRYQEDEVRCTYQLYPADTTAWDYDVFVFPKHRLSMTFAKLWEFANGIMIQRGVKYTYSRISYTNVDSLNAHKKLGCGVVGAIYFFTFFRLQLAFSWKIKPFITLSVSRKHFPNFYIS